MNRSEVIETLKKKYHVFNSHNLCREFGGRIYVDFSRESGRGGRGSFCQVIGIREKTEDTPGNWMNSGRETFNGKKNITVPQAKEWAGKKYAIAEWGTDPFGGYQDIEVLKRMKEALKG
jgi:hypothetical protein